MLTIGFIQPSSEYLFDPFRGDPFTHYHILTILEEKLGKSVNLRLIDLRGIKKEFSLYHIPECDIYLHSVYTLDYQEQLEIVGQLRLKHPRAIHVAGGPHVGSFPEESLKVFDSLVLGEGEETIVQAVRDFLTNKLQKIYRQDCAVDINAYPVVRRHFLPKNVTTRKNMITLRQKPGFDELNGTTALFSRGCPYNCYFCAIHTIGEIFSGIRFRTPQNIEREIEYLKKNYDIEALVLLDEICLPLKKDQAIQRLEAIARASIVWRGQCRVDGLTPEITKLARQSGCMAMGLGVESVSQSSLDLINKKIEVEKSKRTIALLKANDIEARVYMIIGLPGEPEDIVEKTWSFIEETDPDLVALSLFTVRPGTEVYDHPEKFGIKNITTDWSKTMHMWSRYNSEEPVMTFEYEVQTPWGQSMTNDQIIKNYLELQKRLKERDIGTSYYKNKPHTPS